MKLLYDYEKGVNNVINALLCLETMMNGTINSVSISYNNNKLEAYSYIKDAYQKLYPIYEIASEDIKYILTYYPCLNNILNCFSALRITALPYENSYKASLIKYVWENGFKNHIKEEVVLSIKGPSLKICLDELENECFDKINVPISLTRKTLIIKTR